MTKKQSNKIETIEKMNTFLSEGFKALIDYNKCILAAEIPEEVNKISHHHTFQKNIKTMLKNAENNDIRERLFKAEKLLELYENIFEFEDYVHKKKHTRAQGTAIELNQLINDYAEVFISSGTAEKYQEKAQQLRETARKSFDEMHKDSFALYYLSNILIGITLIGLIPLALKGALTGHGFFYETTRQTHIQKIKSNLDKIEPEKPLKPSN